MYLIFMPQGYRKDGTPTGAKKGHPAWGNGRKGRTATPTGVLINERAAGRAVTTVNHTRLRMAARVRTVYLWGSLKNKARKNDHPLIHAIYAMRDEFDELAELVADPIAETSMAARKERIAALGKLFDMTLKLTQESNKSSVEIQGVLQYQLTMKQRQKEHDEKLAVLKEKMNVGGFSPEELQEMAKEFGSGVIAWSSTGANDVKVTETRMDEPAQVRVAETVVTEPKTTGMGPMKFTDDRAVDAVDDAP